MANTAGDISLNSVGYVLEEPKRVIEETDAPFADSFQIGGQRTAQSLVTRDTRTFSFCGGALRDVIPSDKDQEAKEYRRFRWATAHTLDCTAGAVLSILEEDSTETGLEVIRASVDAFGEHWGIWEDDTSKDIVSRAFDGATLTWGGGGTVKNGGSGEIVIGGPVRLYKGNLVAVLVFHDGASTNDIESADSADGATWTNRTAANSPGQNFIASQPSANEDLDFALLEEIAGELVVAVYDFTDSQIKFRSMVTVGTWVSETPVIHSNDGPTGLAVLSGPDNADRLLVGTEEGVWSVDVSAATWVVERKILSLPRHADNCRRMVVTNNSLFVSQGVSDNEPPPIYRIFANEFGWVVEAGWGFDVLDSVPTEALGPVRWMAARQDTLFVSMGGGAASRNAYVMALRQDDNGEWGWHTVARHGTANQKIEWVATSAEDDGVPRVHYARRTSSSTSDTASKAYVLTPVGSGLQKYETSGYVDLPEFNGGLPNIEAAFLRMDVDAVDLSADNTGEYIEGDFGMDGDARTTNDLGTGNDPDGDALDSFFSAKKTRFIGDTSGSLESGVSGKSFASRLTLNRDAGDNTDTPKLRSVTVNYEKVPETIKSYRVRIDLNRTAENQNRSVENVLGDLETARDSVALVPFVYSELGTKYVRLRPFRHTVELSLKGSSGGRGSGNTKVKRGGVIEVTLSEKI